MATSAAQGHPPSNSQKSPAAIWKDLREWKVADRSHHLFPDRDEESVQLLKPRFFRSG